MSCEHQFSRERLLAVMEGVGEVRCCDKRFCYESLTFLPERGSNQLLALLPFVDDLVQPADMVSPTQQLTTSLNWAGTVSPILSLSLYATPFPVLYIQVQVNGLRSY